MKIIISHMTALEACRKIASSGLAKPCRVKSLVGCVSSERHMAAIDLTQMPFSTSGQIDILVPDVKHRFRSKRLRRHAWSGPLPDGSFYRISDDVIVTSPEFSLLLMSKSLSFNELVKMCSETCSRFYYTNDERSFAERPPITTLQRLLRFVEKAEGAVGATKLRRALRYAVENARSPMEITLGIMMSMPARLGGFGIGKPVLNFRIDLAGKTSAIAGRKHVEIDFYYPDSKVGLEYDSNQFHSGESRISSDARRNNVLRSRGLTIINLTWEQVRDPFLLEGAMRQAAKAMCKKLAEPSGKGRANRMRLYSELLPMARIPDSW